MANFSKFYNRPGGLSDREGGFQKMRSDKGNYNSAGELVGTNHGISAPVYESWAKSMEGKPATWRPTEQDMRSITIETAKKILERNYWQRMQGDSINGQDAAEIIIDMGVHAGTGRATKLLQEVLNDSFKYNLKIDGGFGPITLNAVNATPQTKLYNKYRTKRLEWYATNGGVYKEAFKRRIEQNFPILVEPANETGSSAAGAAVFFYQNKTLTILSVFLLLAISTYSIYKIRGKK